MSPRTIWTFRWFLHQQGTPKHPLWIDTLIESKRELAENVIGSGGENWITELSNEELMQILRLD